MPFRAWLTGQLTLASSAAAWKAASSAPGTVPSTVRWMPVMPSPGTKVTSAEVVRRVGGVPALSRMLEKAIEKQLECAAAISSSGLVLPLASSARDAQVTGCSPMLPEESKETTPLPLKRLPSQTVCAERVVAMTHPFESVRPCVRPCSVREPGHRVPGSIRSHSGSAHPEDRSSHGERIPGAGRGGAGRKGVRPRAAGPVPPAVPPRPPPSASAAARGGPARHRRVPLRRRPAGTA
ncbi:conserved hypothetical protein [Streptomyces viridosporus ATCC 14672]|uniref:Uncharacterized protein n=1 Tax=Streptomyces viridosporus (strain ATCC 14672 / DSM 40746 / JCM 4963 / KCTC 9882 / NRRL B-12104 / FH 1290) TaxID=566461 RepID=D6A637_STRV1|nr:conserved hypothetical protein [Streptomyces viridosporus ATCC 14672]